MTLFTKKVSGSEKFSHQLVQSEHTVVGEIWREQVNVVVSKFTEPRRTGVKWRWFAKQTGSSKTLGRGTRAAMLLGPGFKTKDEVISALAETCDLNVN